MSKYMRINVDAFEEKGNRGGGSGIDPNKDLKNLHASKERVKRIHKEWKQLRKAKNGNYIFHIEYKNLIPPKTKRIIFNSDFYNGSSKVNKITDVRQRGIFTRNEYGNLLVNLYYEINVEEYNGFKEFLNHLLKKEDVTKKDGYLIRNLKKLNDINKIANQMPPSQIARSKVIQLLPIDSIISKLFEIGILNEKNYLKDLNIAFLAPDKYLKVFNDYPDIIVSCENKEELKSFKIVGKQIFYNNQFKPKWRKTKIGVIDSGVSLKEDILEQGIIFSKDLREFKKFQDLNHGTIVSSLIIANDELNPGQKDGFGNFKIKHFEILEPFSKGTPPILKFEHLRSNLEKIIKQNSDIKVWNLSFGSIKKPYDLKVSHTGAFLDLMSYKYNVIFVCPSGNDRDKVDRAFRSLNHPADSLNALSVGSVQRDKNSKIEPSSYSSIGPILHFEKPEISHFGGPHNLDDSLLQAINGNGFCTLVEGTSFAAPRISRMIAHYIDIGYGAFEAKAKLLNMATKESPSKKSAAFGYVKLEDGDVELRLTVTLKNKKPLYLPLELIEGTEKIIISSCSIVRPNNKFGEEYNIHNFDVSLIWYDPLKKNPEHEKRSKTLVSEETSNKRYLNEISLRMENGKYFNSSKKTFIYDKDKNMNPEPKSYKLALRVRKQDLFDTIEMQKSKVSIAISIFGSFNLLEFETRNSAIVFAEAEQEAYSDYA